MHVLDLFSGIGGFTLGLERAGFKTKAFCEIDPYCRRVLARHWPDVPVYDDVRTLTAARLVADAEYAGCYAGEDARTVGGKKSQWSLGVETQYRQLAGCNIDVICGGFPCQDISNAGKGAGITGKRSGLWKEYARIIGEVRPRYVIVENVAALLHRGLGDVLGDLAALGYDAEWHCIPASAVGAPHRRDRVWIIAYPQHPDADSAGPHRASQHLNGGAEFCHEQVSFAGSVRENVADADAGRQLQSQGYLGEIGRWLGDSGWWLTEPDVGRVAHGVPARVDRLKSLGNAVVPQIPEIIGRAILRAEGR